MLDPTTRRTVRALAAAAVALLLGATAACGGSDDAASPGGSDSSSASSGSPSAASSPLTKADLGPRLSSALTKAGTFSFTLRTKSAQQTLTGTGTADVSGAKPATDATVEVAGQSAQARLVDGTYYLKSAGVAPDGKWLKIEPGSGSGVAALLQQLGASSDPTRIISVLGKASSVTAKGRTEVDGTPTTRYVVALPSTAISSVLGFPEALVKELPDTIEYTIDVDGDDLVRRQEATLTIRDVRSTSAITFDDFGEKVSIAAPPADQITTSSSIPGLGG